LQELHLLSSQGYRQFLFVDDNFTLNSKRVLNLCNRLRKEKVDIEFFAEGRVDNCPQNMLNEMSRSKCRMVYFGIENATQKVLDYYNKQTNSKQAMDAVKKTRRAGIDVIVASFIVGAPYETTTEIKNTLNFAKKLKVDIPQFNILAAFPGTDIWEELKTQGLVDEEKQWETGVMVSEVSPNSVPTKEIEKLIHDGYQRFFIRPDYILKQLFKIGKSSYRLNVLLNNLKRIDSVTEGVKFVT
jgi:radical SAM superfamily enzyme YgiQ (UPF0313 family)